MRTFQSGNLKVVAFDYGVYLQERNVLECSIERTSLQWQDCSIVLSHGGSTIATYKVDADKKAYIDLTDYLRYDYELNGDGAVVVTAYGGTANIGSVSVPWDTAGVGVSPARLLAPPTEEAESAKSVSGASVAWCLPTRIVQPIGTQRVVYAGLAGCYTAISTGALERPDFYAELAIVPSAPISISTVIDVISDIYIAVFSHSVASDYIQSRLVYEYGAYLYSFDDEAVADATSAEVQKDRIDTNIGESTLFSYKTTIKTIQGATTYKQITQNAVGYLELTETAKMVGIADDKYNILQSVNIVPRVCGKQYASVYWSGATGDTKIATWELREHKVEQGERVSILTPTGAFDERVGRVDSMVLRLDALTAFDVWYYGDIVTSGDVRISLDGSTWQVVKVETKDVQVPDGDGGELAELKVSVIYDEYDAVDM